MAVDVSKAAEPSAAWEPYPIPASAGGWRPIVVARVVTLHLELRQAGAGSKSADYEAAEHEILAFLQSAWQAAVSPGPSVFRSAFWRGAAPDTAWLALHAAEEAPLPLQSDDVVRAKAKTIVARGKEPLGPTDPRVVAMVEALHRMATRQRCRGRCVSS